MVVNQHLLSDKQLFTVICQLLQDCCMTWLLGNNGLTCAATSSALLYTFSCHPKVLDILKDS